MKVSNRTGIWKRVLPVAFAAGVFCLLFSGTTWAQMTDHKTVVTFYTPVEVPGSDPQILPAGTYIFKVVDSKTDRNVVQISNENETHIYTTVLAIPIARDLETSRTVMTFVERPVGNPQTLRAWFYPYEKHGQEFVYSKRPIVPAEDGSDFAGSIP